MRISKSNKKLLLEVASFGGKAFVMMVITNSLFAAATFVGLSRDVAAIASLLTILYAGHDLSLQMHKKHNQALLDSLREWRDEMRER